MSKIIAIDPDVSGSGVCILSNELIFIGNMQLWQLFDRLYNILIDGLQNDYEVIIEQSTSTNTWHKGGKGAARNVGRNYEISNQIARFCQIYKIKFRTIEPQGFSKVSHKSFNEITKWNLKKTNTETRVAGLFAFHVKRGIL